METELYKALAYITKSRVKQRAVVGKVRLEFKRFILDAPIENDTKDLLVELLYEQAE